jgi:transcriptional regulator with XRE-family HTH domain
VGIGFRIREARRAMNYTQSQLADVVGIHEITLSRWENEVRVPSGKALQKIAIALNTSVAYLVSETDDQELARKQTIETNKPILDLPDDDPLRVASKRLLDGMTPDQLRKAYEYLRDQKQLAELLKEKGA